MPTTTTVKSNGKEYEIETWTQKDIEERQKKLIYLKEETYKTLLRMKSQKWPNKL
jgi:hypothetical protein